MPWFTAHAVMYFEHTDGPQDGYVVWENVFLVDAADSKQAHVMAEAFARREETGERNSLTVNDRPARLVFGGIRQVVSVCHNGVTGELASGDEVTYSEFEVA